MAYTKTVWNDEVLGEAERFVIKNNAGSTVTSFAELLQCAITLWNTPTEAGTPVEEDAMNNIENGIYDLSRAAAYSVKGVAGSSTGDVADISASSDNTVLRRSGTSIGFGTVPNAALADHKEQVYIRVLWPDESVAVGDGAFYFNVPPYLAGNIVDFDIAIDTVSSSGLVTVQMAKCNSDHNGTYTDILSTKATVDVNEYSSLTASTPPVISSAAVISNDWLRIDVDVAGTGAKGLSVFFVIEKSA
jgi:hypothetical protein